MCSRYMLTSPPEAVRQMFGYAEQPNFPPRYNIAPSQPIAIVAHNVKRKPAFLLVRWGLIPGWVKDLSAFKTMLINARSETVMEKPSFRAAIKRRRCLVPADGFIEWTGPKGRREPFWFKPKEAGPIAFAGIYEHWLGADGSELDSAAILTVPANGLVGRIHDRMPAIIDPCDFASWLDCERVPADEAMALVGPAPEHLLEPVAISTAINDPRAEGEALVLPRGHAALF